MIIVLWKKVGKITLLDTRKNLSAGSCCCFDKNFQFLSKKNNNFPPKDPFCTLFERSEKQCVVRH